MISGDKLSSLLSLKAQKVRSPVEHSPWNGPGTLQHYRICTIAFRFVSSSLENRSTPGTRKVSIIHIISTEKFFNI